MTAAAAVAEKLRAALGQVRPGLTAIDGLHRLTGGASRETWRFNAIGRDGAEPMILRRAPGEAHQTVMATSLLPSQEARLHQAADKAGVPVASVVHVLTDDDALGDGFIMRCLDGETIARKILREKHFSMARSRLPAQCGEALAALHAIEPAAFRNHLPTRGPQAEIDEYRAIHDGFGEAHPVFEAAFRWLSENVPPDRPMTLVHGDFRIGNLMIDDNGLVAVLDWELAQIGDPMMDLSWISVPSWRFGNMDRPVGGISDRESLFDAYEAASGRSVDRERVRFWEILGTLKWGIMCQMLCHAHLRGDIRSVERAAIGRRVSETELDLLLYLDGAMP